MFDSEVFLWIISAVFVVSALFQLFFYLYIYLAPLTLRKNDRGSKGEAVSVIICARNEAANLEKFLPSILEQKYEDFEVIVVNDCSEDDTDILLGSLSLKYKNLKVSTIKKDAKFSHFKKFAMFIGIKAAKNELLLFTDADCEPVGPEWISKMVSGFEEGKEIVLGYGGYFSGEGLLNKYIRYDTFFIAMQYFGMARRGLPYMGVGRNLAYRRSMFFRNGGFGKYNTLMSGDDDLFVHENGNSANVALELRKESFTPFHTIIDFQTISGTEEKAFHNRSPLQNRHQDTSIPGTSYQNILLWHFSLSYYVICSIGRLYFQYSYLGCLFSLSHIF